MKTNAGALLALCLATVATVWSGCAAEEIAPGPERDGVGGKADDLTDEDCEGTSLDGSQVCRASNGQFAPSACCAAEVACLNATIDDGGACRDGESGQFVAKTCCEALCGGAAIVNGFCRNEDSGQFMLNACCQDICFELDAPFAAEEPGSCGGSCGDQSSNGDCFCDDICAEEGDCCADIADECPEFAPGGFESEEGNSCEDACGDQSPSGACFCDEVCAELGDCCGDKVAQCGGEGDDNIVACEVDECEGAEVDDDFVCRKANGQFANSACCGLDRCDSADLEETADGDFLCRDDDSGQFIPMVCCEQRCDGADIDRSGTCRKGDGTFADPSCCADACFTAARRGGDPSGLAACNGTQG